MNKITVFLYLKIFQFIQCNDYKFEHTLFHLHRFLRVNKDIRWERLFVFEEDKMVDDGKNKAIRTLLHHNFIHYEHHTLTTEGQKWLKESEEVMSELNQNVEDFFSQYKGEYAYENSCFGRKDIRTIACHLCDDLICEQKDRWSDILKSTNLFKIKKPYRSFSKKTT